MAKKLQVTYDCADPGAQAAFWAEVLGYRVQPPPEGFPDWPAALTAWGVPPERHNDRSAILDPDGNGPRLFFQKVPEGRFRELRTDEQLLPHVVHLDINVGNGRKAEHHEVDAEVQRLVGLGATVIRKHDEAWGPWPEYHYVMADPEGHVFCVQ